MQDSGSLAVFKVTARDQGHYKRPSGAFITYCNSSCFSVEIQSLTPFLILTYYVYVDKREFSFYSGKKVVFLSV